MEGFPRRLTCIALMMASKQKVGRSRGTVKLSTKLKNSNGKKNRETSINKRVSRLLPKNKSSLHNLSKSFLFVLPSYVIVRAVKQL